MATNSADPATIQEFILELFRFALDNEKAVVTCKSHAAALGLRSKVYRFRNRLLRNPELDPRIALAAPAAQTLVEGPNFILRFPKETQDAPTSRDS